MRLTSAIAALALVLIAAGCGGGSGSDLFDQEIEADPFDSSDDAGDPFDSGNDGGDDGGLSLICEDPPPTEVGVGSSTEGFVASRAPAPCFWVDVPEGLDSVSFELAGVGSDVGINVGYGFITRVQFPGPGEFWTDEQPGADEIISINDPKPGPYYVTIGVVGFQNEADFTFGVTASPATTTEPTGASIPEPGTCAPPAATMEIGESRPGTITGREEPPPNHDYYCVEVPGGIDQLTISTSGLTDSLEVIVRRGDGRVWRAMGLPDSDAVVLVESPDEGAYFIDVVAGAGRASDYVVTVEAP